MSLCILDILEAYDFVTLCILDILEAYDFVTLCILDILEAYDFVTLCILDILEAYDFVTLCILDILEAYVELNHTASETALKTFLRKFKDRAAQVILKPLTMPQGYTCNFMLNSTKHEFSTVLKRTC